MSVQFARLSGAVIKNGTIRSILERKIGNNVLPGVRQSSHETWNAILTEPYFWSAGGSLAGAGLCMIDSWLRK